MKIEYEIKDKEFPVLLAALNNGFISLKSTYLAMRLGCDVPKAFKSMQDKYNFDELDQMTEERLKVFFEFYQHLENLQKLE